MILVIHSLFTRPLIRSLSKDSRRGLERVRRIQTLKDDCCFPSSRVLLVLQFCVVPCNGDDIIITKLSTLSHTTHHPNLTFLAVHFQVVSHTSPMNPRLTLKAGPAASLLDCILATLLVGGIPMPEGFSQRKVEEGLECTPQPYLVRTSRRTIQGVIETP